MESKKSILAIDSATSILRVGLIDAEGIIRRQESRDKFRHAEHIVGLIDRVLNEGQQSRKEIGGIIVSIGPGSFTGLRVGLAVAKGMGISLEIPVAGRSIYNAMAPKIMEHFGPTALLIPSRRDEFYFGLVEGPEFDDSKIEIVAIRKLTEIAEIRKMLFVDFDPASLELPNASIIDKGESFVTIDDFLQGARSRIDRGGDDLARLEPIYIQKFPFKASK